MLHGDIRVNDVVICEWTAANIGHTNTGLVGEFRRYHCTLWYRASDGYIYDADWEIWGHMMGDGAVTLAERVLKEGKHRAKRRIPQDLK